MPTREHTATVEYPCYPETEGVGNAENWKYLTNTVVKPGGVS